MATDVEVPLCPCPHCGRDVDMATNPYNDRIRPKPGDWSVCSECGGYMVFGPKLELQLPKVQDFLDTEPELLRKLTHMRNALAIVRKERDNERRGKGSQRKNKTT